MDKAVYHQMQRNEGRKMPMKYFLVGYEDGSQIVMEIETLEDMCAFIEENKYRYVKMEEITYDFMELFELSGLAERWEIRK